MCYFCDGGTIEELDQDITRHLMDTGWSVQGVERRNGRLDWAYTIGLAQRFDHPELAVTAMCCFRCAGSLLNQAARVVASGRQLSVGDVLDLAAPVRVGSVHPDQWQGDRFAVWHGYYSAQSDVPPQAALQLLWADAHGTWQDDPVRHRWRRERLDLPPGAGLTARTGGPSTSHRRRQRRRRR